MSLAKKLLGAAFAGALTLGTPYSNHARAENPPAFAAEFPELEKYGTVTFRKNPEASDQIYIVPLTHRNSLTGKLDEEMRSPRVNKDVYRIARCLIENRNVNLILREGWLSSEDYADMNAAQKQKIREELAPYKDFLMNNDDIIVASLGAEEPDYFPGKQILDGITLLNLSYDVGIQGVEDAAAHQTVLDLMAQSGDKTQEALLNLFRIKQANEVRSGKALYNLPDIIGREREAGRTTNNNAILTIGVDHIREIRRFIETNEVYIFPQPHLQQEEVKFKLNLENYGFTIIEPNSLPEQFKTK